MPPSRHSPSRSSARRLVRSRSRGKSDIANGTDLRKMLDAANAASQAARNAWLGYLFILAYLAVTLIGVTHKDLLLNTPTRLPFVNVEIPLTGFFILSPPVLLFFLFGLLLQHQMLYYKLLSLAHALPPEPTAHGGTDVRDEIHSYFFTQAVVGRRHNRRAVTIAFRVMLFATFIAAPLFLLYYFQIRFLPYHSEAITWWHRLNVIGGVAALCWVGCHLSLIDCKLRRYGKLGIRNWINSRTLPLFSYIRRLNSPLERRFFHLRNSIPPSAHVYLQPVAKILAWARPTLSRFKRRLGWFVFVVLLGSICTASVPGSIIDKIMGTLFPKQFVPLGCYANYGDEKHRVFFLTALLHESERDPKHRCWWQDWIGSSRNLLLADQDFIKDKDIFKGEFVHVLRKRDLRYADFSRSDMRSIDFEDAQLQHSLFVESDLKGSRFRITNLQDIDFSEASLQNADLFRASLQGADLSFASLQGADLRGARLQGADLTQAFVWQTRLDPGIKKFIFDARLLQIDWLSYEIQKELRSTIAELKALSEEMQRSKTPGRERVKAITDRVEQKLKPFLEQRPLLAQTHAPLKIIITNNCPWHRLRNRAISAAEIVTERAAALAQTACDDDTQDALVAKSIVRQVHGNRPLDPRLASLVLQKLNEKSCQAVREKLPAQDLRALQKLAAEKPDQTDDQPNANRRPRDAGDYLCGDRPASAP